MALRLKPNKEIEKFLLDLPAKHFKQIMMKVLKLLGNPFPQDYKKIHVNHVEYCRIDVGEYRIIYKIEKESLYLVLIEKRNDSEVYKALKRKTHLSTV